MRTNQLYNKGFSLKSKEDQEYIARLKYVDHELLKQIKRLKEENKALQDKINLLENLNYDNRTS